MKRKTKIWLIIIGVCLFLMLGNPEPGEFAEYANSKYGVTAKGRSYRKYNFLLFSIYKVGRANYLGALFNFIKTGEDDNYYREL